MNNENQLMNNEHQSLDQEHIEKNVAKVFDDIRTRGLDAYVKDVNLSKHNHNVSDKQILQYFSQSFLKVARANR